MAHEITFQAPLLPVKRYPILVFGGLLLVFVFLGASLFYFIYAEQKGSFKSTTDVVDLDRDGDLDVIVGRTRWERTDISWALMTVWINLGDGRFVPRAQELPGGFAAAAGDVDGDGAVDLSILNGYEITLALNEGGSEGIFRTRGVIRSPHHWRGHVDMGGGLVLGDLNNDGLVDGFVASCCYGQTGVTADDDWGNVPSASWLWINKGGLRHSTSLLELEGLPVRSAALGDLDGDGFLDIFTAVGKPTLGVGSSLADRVLLNDGLGNFADSGQRLGESDSYAAALGDLDGDGDLDAMVGTRSGAVVWINQGGTAEGQEGVFARSPQKISGQQVRAVLLHDLDGDGDLDALIAGLRQAVIWWNNGQAEFAQSDQSFRYSVRQGLALEDFNGDGFPDIFAGGGDAGYYVWLNQGDRTFRPGNLFAD